MVIADTLVVNAHPLLTMISTDGNDRFGTIDNGAVAIKDGRVLEVGSTGDLLLRHGKCTRIIDTEGKLTMPGFVDSHTHAVYGGSREDEWMAKLQGASYLDILRAGGGIHATVATTRAASEDALIRRTLLQLDRMAAHGTTTVEIKSGYGLERETEKKMLSVIHGCNQRHPLDVVPTYLGAHAVPKNKSADEYVAQVIEGLSEIVPLAEFVDVFCEDGAFDVDQARQLLQAATRHGFKLKIHAGQFTDLGAAGMAASLKAVSCDHLEAIDDDQIKSMKDSGSVATLLPGVPFFLKTGVYPNARRFIDQGVPVALATDFNPGSCPSFSMQMMVTLGATECGLSVEEALYAATMGGAMAIERSDTVGSLAPGKQADLVILDVTEPTLLPYHFGTNLVLEVIKAGVPIYRSSRIHRRYDDI